MSNHRCRQLQRLTEEHQGVMVLSDTLSCLAMDGDETGLAEGLRRVQEYYEEELEAHLQHEEQTIFRTLMQYGREHFPLCVRLGTEHGILRTLATNLHPETARRDLADFARVLREHTEAEEAELFPLVESLFTTEELDAVMAFAPLPRISNPHGSTT
jgi:hemerythrin-like domain-containing protein